MTRLIELERAKVINKLVKESNPAAVGDIGNPLQGNMGANVTTAILNKEYDLFDVKSIKGPAQLLANIRPGSDVLNGIFHILKLYIGIGNINYIQDNIAADNSLCFSVHAQTFRATIRQIGGAVGNISDGGANIGYANNPLIHQDVTPAVIAGGAASGNIIIDPYVKFIKITRDLNTPFNLVFTFGGAINIAAGQDMDWYPIAGTPIVIITNTGVVADTYHLWYHKEL
jgi:hypothetical protein